MYIFLGEVCRKGQRPEQDYVCMSANSCKAALQESIRTSNYLDICNFDGLLPIVCCPIMVNGLLIAENNKDNLITVDKSTNIQFQYKLLPIVYIYMAAILILYVAVNIWNWLKIVDYWFFIYNFLLQNSG